jgi:CheY-like chemotaxis protein
MTTSNKTKSKSSRSILLVEDQKYNLMVLKKMLEYMEFDVITAENGKEAVDICQKINEFDLILMDLKMPVMDGYSAMKEIKKILPEMPIIAETAYALAGDEKKIIEAGFDDYLPKPITRESLSAVISRNLH